MISTKSGVYCIKNIINNKFYIGSTVNFKQRWRDHKKLLNSGKHFNIYLQNAMNKYSLDSFEFKVLYTCDISEAKNLEQLLLDNNLGDYNLDKIVIKSGVRSKNRKFSDEDIQKIRWLYSQEYLLKDIAKLFKTNGNTLNNIVKNYYYTDVIGLKECSELTTNLRKRQAYRSTKFTDIQIKDIRNRYKNKESAKKLYTEYKISDTSFYKIVNRNNYKHIT